MDDEGFHRLIFLCIWIFDILTFLLFSIAGRKKTLKTQTDISKTDMERNYKPPVKKTEIIRTQAAHPSLRATLEEEFQLETCTTCNFTPNTIVSRFIQANQSKSKMYTGLDEYDRETLWQYLGTDKYHLTMADQEGVLSGHMRKLSVKCQFLLTLMILRRDYDYTEIAGWFDVSDRIVSSVFKTWIIFMSRKFRYVYLKSSHF